MTKINISFILILNFYKNIKNWINILPLFLIVQLQIYSFIK